MNARIAVALVVLLAIVAGLATLPSRPTTKPGLPSTPSATPDGETFRAGFRPLLEHAFAQADALSVMGEARERNLLRIRAGQYAMTEALAAADGWLAAHQPAPADKAAIAVYQEGAAAIRAAMEEAQAGFLRLDFDRVAAATETMRRGADALARAVSLLPD